jgi:hypothetical protein
MAKFGWTIGKKAAKTTAKHSARGVASKAKRKPLRSVSLLGIGGAVGGAAGVVAGWIVGRKNAAQPSPPQ